MSERNLECLNALVRAGISWDDAWALRRIAMTLHRWHELECGDSNDYASWTVARGRKDNGGAFEYDDDNGEPYEERHVHSDIHGERGPRYTRIPDRENGAKKRLAKIMARYPTLGAYIQGDPRGAALYILRSGDVPAGERAEGYYSRGVAVYK